MTEVGVEQLNDFENAVETGEDATMGDDPGGEFTSGDCGAEAMNIMKPPPLQIHLTKILKIIAAAISHIGHGAGGAPLDAAEA